MAVGLLAKIVKVFVMVVATVAVLSSEAVQDTVSEIADDFAPLFESKTKEDKAEEKVKDGVDKPQNDKKIIFPVNPHNFNPKGLIKIEREGTSNGKLINWMDPYRNIEVFRWDENPNFPNGPHYHIYGSGHYIPGVDKVPDIYAKIYF